MKMIITGVCILLLSGCGIFPNKPEQKAELPAPTEPKREIPEQKLLVDDEVYAMSRLEVMAAINECQSARTRAVVIYGKRKVGGVTRDIVVDVTCAPLY